MSDDRDLETVEIMRTCYSGNLDSNVDPKVMSKKKKSTPLDSWNGVSGVEQQQSLQAEVAVVWKLGDELPLNLFQKKGCI